MRRLRTAVCGLGRIGWQFHLPELVKHADTFELAGVMDPLHERRQEAENAFRTKSYADLAQLLASERPDLLVIASPTSWHAEQAILAMQHGCHVLCDKPMSATLADADRMIAVMHASRRALLIYQPQRCTAEVVALRATLQQNLIGPIYMIKRSWTAYTRRNDWQALRRHGGGMLNNYGPHAMDLLLHLAGSSAARICCATRTIASLGDAEDVVKAVIETRNGILLDLDINMAVAHETEPWQILGTHGSIRMGDDAWCIRYVRPEHLAPLSLDTGTAAAARQYGNGEKIPWIEDSVPFRDFAAIDFYARVYGQIALDNPPLVPIAESREVMRVLEACRACAWQGATRMSNPASVTRNDEGSPDSS